MCAPHPAHGTIEAITVLASVGASDVAEAQCVPTTLGQSLLYVVSWHPILCLRKETGVCVLRFGYFLAEVRVVRALRVESNRIGPVVELVNHPALIQRQIKFLALLPTVALDRIETFRIELFSRPKKMRVISHVKHVVYFTGHTRFSLPCE